MERMKHFLFIFPLFLWIAAGGGTARAAEMTRGFVQRVNNYQVVIAIPRGGERTFDVTRNTFVVRAKRAIPISDLRRNTLVQVTSKNAEAQQILIVEAPK